MEEKNRKVSKTELPKYYYRKNGKREDAEVVRARARRYYRADPKRASACKQKNREHYREYMRKFFIKRRKYAAANGLCGNCLRKKDNDETILCTACRDRARKNAKAQRERRQNARKINNSKP